MAVVAQKRAKVGGEFGANGEWYEGGKFINTIPKNRKKEGSHKRGTGKQEIAPYTWEVAPNGELSLYRKFAGAWGRVENGKAIFAFGSDIERLNHVLAYFGVTKAQAQEMLDKWNAGQRWV